MGETREELDVDVTNVSILVARSSGPNVTGWHARLDSADGREYLRKRLTEYEADRAELAEAKAEVERLKGLLQEVREDGTGSIEGKRVWPIRAALYRRIAATLEGREVCDRCGFPHKTEECKLGPAEGEAGEEAPTITEDESGKFLWIENCRFVGACKLKVEEDGTVRVGFKNCTFCEEPGA